jgi:hypothetical protein
MLNVLSALARLDIDPWQEAAKLARMTRDKAVCRMARLGRFHFFVVTKLWLVWSNKANVALWRASITFRYSV